MQLRLLTWFHTHPVADVTFLGNSLQVGAKRAQEPTSASVIDFLQTCSGVERVAQGWWREPARRHAGGKSRAQSVSLAIRKVCASIDEGGKLRIWELARGGDPKGFRVITFSSSLTCIASADEAPGRPETPFPET